ncbi:MAG: hypothetical protein LBV77_06705 [Candidatus Adiutrix intracellularis]|jgi:hypothetical protein|nr:hypothetical protein [Candidatus Adiutrix intracellularis]
MERYKDTRDSLTAFRKDYTSDLIIPKLLIIFLRQNWQKAYYTDARWPLDELFFNYPKELRNIYFLLARDEEDCSRDHLKATTQDWNNFHQAFPEDPKLDQNYFDHYKKLIFGNFPKGGFKLAKSFHETATSRDVTISANLRLKKSKNYFALNYQSEDLATWEYFCHDFLDDLHDPGLLLTQAHQELKSKHGDLTLAHYQEIINHCLDQPRMPDVYLKVATTETNLNRYITLFLNYQKRPQIILTAIKLGRQLNHLSETMDLFKLFHRNYHEMTKAPKNYLTEAHIKITAGNQNNATKTLKNELLTSPYLSNDFQAQALLSDLYLELGRGKDWPTLMKKNLNQIKNPTSDLANRFLKYNQLAQFY